MCIMFQLCIHVCLCSSLYLFDLHSETDFSFSFLDGADYIGTNGNIIFMPREADVICNDIDILDDDIEEQNEFFSIIFSFVNVSAESSLITITISDDDQIGKHMHVPITCPIH